MAAEQKARELGISFPVKEKGYLNLCVRSGNLLITSGHVSDVKGKLGAGLSVEQGYQAARECAVKVLQSVRQAHGTLDGLRVLKLLGCVNSAPDFTDQHLVVNGASDLLRRLSRPVERGGMEIDAGGCCALRHGHQPRRTGHGIGRRNASTRKQGGILAPLPIFQPLSCDARPEATALLEPARIWTCPRR